jgi:hypothetical protein
VQRHRALDDARMAAVVWRVLNGGADEVQPVEARENESGGKLPPDSPR